jgi:hypothetical protein
VSSVSESRRFRLPGSLTLKLVTTCSQNQNRAIADERAHGKAQIFKGLELYVSPVRAVFIDPFLIATMDRSMVTSNHRSRFCGR